MDDIVREARELFDEAESAETENRQEGAKDLKFLALEQWPEVVRRDREARGAPCMTFTRLNQYERQITGDMRLNPPSIKVRPVDGGADPATAKVFTGLIRNIEAQSNGVRAYLTAAANAVRCGEGWFGLLYDYVGDSFDMEFQFRRFASPFAVTCDPNAAEPTASDMGYGFVSTLMHKTAFRAAYPKASLSGFDSGDGWTRWKDGDFVRVCEYWRKVPVTKRLALLGDNRVIDITDKADAEIAEIAAKSGGVLRERKAEGYAIEMRKMSGVEELEDVHDWPGCMIPLVRVVGEEINVGDRVVRFGIVRPARDPQALYNIQRTAMVEAVAMAPKAKWVGTVEQFKGRERQWGAANISSDALLIYTADPRAPGPPQRIAPETPSAALLADVQAAAMDIEAAVGIYRENLGKESNAQSGKAILSRQREGDVGTFLFGDNLADSVAQAGRILIDSLPKVMDTPRQVRTLGEDGSEEFVTLNQEMIDPRTGAPTRMNDLSVGRFDVVSSIGPSFSTKREEEREMLMAMGQANPMFLDIGADILVGAMDTPGSEKLHKRLRAIAIAKGYEEPGEGDKPPQPQPPGADVLLAQAEMAKAQAQMMKVQSDSAARETELRLREMELMIKAREVGADITLGQSKLQLEQVETAARVAGDIARHHTERMDRRVTREDGLRARAEDRMMQGGWRQ
jgi:hypothetical protein